MGCTASSQPAAPEALPSPTQARAAGTLLSRKAAVAEESKAGAKASGEESPKEIIPVGERTQCPSCRRLFSVKRSEAHQRCCLERAVRDTREVFEASRQRAGEGSPFVSLESRIRAEHYRQLALKEAREQRRAASTWRSDHEAFLRACRLGRRQRGSRDAFAEAIVKMPAREPLHPEMFKEVAEVGPRRQCEHCRRMVLYPRFDKHQNACMERPTRLPRPVFSSALQRGTSGASPFLPRASYAADSASRQQVLKQAAQARAAAPRRWREEHETFVAACRRGRGIATQATPYDQADCKVPQPHRALTVVRRGEPETVCCRFFL